jgi:hypothetical protein
MSSFHRRTGDGRRRRARDRQSSSAHSNARRCATRGRDSVRCRVRDGRRVCRLTVIETSQRPPVRARSAKIVLAVILLNVDSRHQG